MLPPTGKEGRWRLLSLLFILIRSMALPSFFCRALFVRPPTLPTNSLLSHHHRRRRRRHDRHDRQQQPQKQPTTTMTTTTTTTALFGIDEWRDLMFDFPGNGDDRRLGTEQGGAPKEICILPFPYDEVLLQGETKQLRLYEDRFLQLFDDCMKNHRGVVAMGLIAESGIIQACPLCEIEAYNRLDGFGIFVTIRVVGRVQLDDILRQEPYLKAVCRELNDSLPPNLEIPNLLASNIENFMLLLSSMERRLAEAETEQENDDDDEDQLSDSDDGGNKETMKRRVQIAKLDDRFYDDLDGGDVDDDDEEEEDEDDVEEPDRRGRFQRAYQVALATDTQGYRVAEGSSTAIDRSPQELAAISWASFCTNILPGEDAAFRIQALDTDSLLERLKLASRVLREKKNRLKAELQNAGLKYKGEEFDEEF